MAFLEDIKSFLGTGARNEEDKNLETFLEEYDPKKYDNPSVTTDIIVIQVPTKFKSIEQGLKLLLIQRRNHPCIGMWALPGGFVELREGLEEAAKRELKEETGLKNIAVEQLYAWGDADRDPRTQIVTVSFLALIEEGIIEVEAGDDAADTMWVTVSFKFEREETVQVNQKLKIKKYYVLTLKGEKGDELLSAKVISFENKSGILKEKNIRVLESNGIAFDHPAMIVQSLLYIENLLK